MHDAGRTMGSGVACGIDKHGISDSRSPSACRSLVSGADVLRDGPNHPRETDAISATATASRDPATSDALGRSVPGGDPTGPGRGEAPSEKRQLGLFTEPEGDGLAYASQPCHAWARLRACEVVRLLNSTPFGPIINDRQFYRHRQRAPWIQCDDRIIDLFKYVAWLATRRNSRKSRKRRIHGRAVITLEELRQILRRQDFRCVLTGQRLTPTNFALDHIVPIAEGGDFTANNSQLVLKTVNRAKNTMSEEDFIEMCRQVARHRGAGSTTTVGQ